MLLSNNTLQLSTTTKLTWLHNSVLLIKHRKWQIKKWQSVPGSEQRIAIYLNIVIIQIFYLYQKRPSFEEIIFWQSLWIKHRRPCPLSQKLASLFPDQLTSTVLVEKVRKKHRKQRTRQKQNVLAPWYNLGAMLWTIRIKLRKSLTLLRLVGSRVLESWSYLGEQFKTRIFSLDCKDAWSCFVVFRFSFVTAKTVLKNYLVLSWVSLKIKAFIRGGEW